MQNVDNEDVIEMSDNFQNNQNPDLQDKDVKSVKGEGVVCSKINLFESVRLN